MNRQASRQAGEDRVVHTNDGKIIESTGFFFDFKYLHAKS